MLMIDPPPPEPPTVWGHLCAAGRLALNRVQRIDWKAVALFVGTAAAVATFAVTVLALLVMLHTSDTTLVEVLHDAPGRVVSWSARDGP